MSSMLVAFGESARFLIEVPIQDRRSYPSFSTVDVLDLCVASLPQFFLSEECVVGPRAQ
ncbi:hypothetical protein DPMN_191915 [Dreissena polymorpha]|uniref:Uncharacterized protein n=1 Tax=Dreissena polymorpha TaxID=45954 RepID=A0A9D3XZ54_DREPO|nr:hypothetical protein DPMN_191915 [Dreissena polymorpha]